MSGWIKLHRSLKEWEWYDDINVKVTFIHLLLSANHAPRKWRGLDIGRGQLWTSISNLSKEVGLSEKQIRNALKKLENTKEIGIQGASKGTMITICKYDSYQTKEETKGEQSGEQGASEGQTRGERGATNKNDKNINNEIIEYLNSRVGSNYKPSTRKTKDVINARLNEGFTIEDFKTVIDIKSKEWENDPKFCKFLRPETLFSNKFEGYLNQQEAKQSRDEELQVHLLKHLRDVQSNDHINEPTDDNRLRRIS